MVFRKYFLTLFVLFIFFSCAGTTSGVKKGNMPQWVNDVYSVYSRTEYVAATGFGNTRAAAEGNALAALTAYFGQNVQVERTAASSQQQIVINGILDSWADSAYMGSSIKTTSSMDNLIGAEIIEVWYDSRGTYYAVAVMNKANGIRIYNELLDNNLDIIAVLIAESSSDPVSFKSVLCLLLSAALADINDIYRNVVVLLDGKTNEDFIVSGTYYRVSANDRISRLNIGIRVANDRNGRIFGAFTRCFADWGFEPVLVQSAFPAAMRYVLDVNLGISPVNLPNNSNVFSRIELSANLTDRNNNAVLIPYTFNSREGHTSQIEAENRCIIAAERNINEIYKSLLSEYFSKLLPGK